MTKSNFQRERRYHVLKLKDVAQLPAKHQQRLQQIEQAVFAIRKGKPLECVVVESDWPIYEATWQQVQAVATGAPVIRDPSLIISALCNAREPAPTDETLEDVARRIRSLSINPFLTSDEAMAIGVAMGSLRRDGQVGPVGLGALVVLEDLLQRNGIDVDRVHDETVLTYTAQATTYDYYAQLMQEKGLASIPQDQFPQALRPLDPVDPDPENPDIMVSRVKSGRVYYNVEYGCLCQIVANYWDDGACYVGERYTDDIQDSYFTTEQDRLREVLPCQS